MQSVYVCHLRNVVLVVDHGNSGLCQNHYVCVVFPPKLLLLLVLLDGAQKRTERYLVTAELLAEDVCNKNEIAITPPNVALRLTIYEPWKTSYVIWIESM